MVSGSRLKPGTFAARYVDSIGGKPQAMSLGTSLLTSAVNAALANAMAAHADETTTPIRSARYAGCGIFGGGTRHRNSRASGNDMLRAVAQAMTSAHGWSCRSTERGTARPFDTTFPPTAAAAAMLRLEPRQVRHAFPMRASRRLEWVTGPATASTSRSPSISAAWGRATASWLLPWWRWSERYEDPYRRQ